MMMLGCGNERVIRAKGPILLVTVDTLRSDHLPTYGYNGVVTPAIDSLASESLVFESVYAHTPLTLPSHASMMTGMWPNYHGVRDNFGYQLADERETLAERYQAAGYRTGAVISSMVLRQSTGVAQGFDDYNDQIRRGMRTGIVNYAERVGEETLALALDWLHQQEDNQFFYWIHLYDPHAPYEPPEQFRGHPNPYDDEIAYVDHLLGRLFSELKSMGLYDEAVIILTSDHGEGLGDHGEQQHGMLLYRESLQVPLILKLPRGIRGGERISGTVGVTDVAPTLCTLSGLAPLGDGLDLLAPIPKERMVFSESLNAKINFGWFPQKSVISGNLHFIRGADEQLFDLVSDQAEKDNLLPGTRVPVPFEDLLESIGTGESQTVEISGEDEAMLRSLGYVGGFGETAMTTDLDESSFLKLFNLVGECNIMLNRGETKKVVKLLEPVVARYPSMIDARLALGSAYFNLGLLSEAESLHLETLALSPQHLTAMVAVIEVKLALKKRGEAEKLAEKAVQTAPNLGPRQVIPILNQYDVFPLAELMSAKAIETDPDFAFAYVVLARGAVSSGEFEKVEPYLMQAADRAMGDSHLLATIAYCRADAAARQGQQADRLFQQAIELDGNHDGARCGFSLYLFSQNRPDEAVANMIQWLEAHPTANTYRRVAQLFELVGLEDLANETRSRMPSAFDP